MRREMKNKWGDKMQDKKKGRQDTRQKKNWETRCETKKMGRWDVKQKKMGS